ncbi:MAG: dynamin family protein [Aureliella sp.]
MDLHVRQLNLLTQYAAQFGLASLDSTLRACAELGREGAIDIAVLGQFKSGKSTLLNTLLGQPLFPVGVLPVTAVVTRVSAGSEQPIRVTHVDGSVEPADFAHLPEFVTEAGNPDNRKQVALVDLFLPELSAWSGLRFVDTPGLGSVFAHNTEATRQWLPSASAALVAVSAERPFSEEDRSLVADAHKTASRVVVVLTKVDLLPVSALVEVTRFVERALEEQFGGEIPVLPFSARVDTQRYVSQLRQQVIDPIVENISAERERSLTVKLEAAAAACQSYLRIALQAAERSDDERARIRDAIFTESVSVSMIRDELASAEQRVRRGTRPTFESLFFAQSGAIQRRVREHLDAESRQWQGNLLQQVEQYRVWMSDALRKELADLSGEALHSASDLLARAEVQFRRVLESFRDRITRNIHRETGTAVSSVSWEPNRPELTVMPVSISHPFMTNWEVIWWLLPMQWVGGLFRRQLLRRVPSEVEKNLHRLTSDWTAATDAAIADLRTQAQAWVVAELETLTRLINQQSSEAERLRDALARLASGRF